MKRLLTIIFLFLLLSCLNKAVAQIPIKQQRTEKPFLFDQVSSRIEIPPGFFQQFLELNPTDSFKCVLPGNIEFRGIVLDKAMPVPGTTALNLRIQNFKNALFNLTITTDIENQQLIRARIIHRQYADVLTLQFENGRYYLVKAEQRLVLAE